jgi:hypothetical protein
MSGLFCILNSVLAIRASERYRLVDAILDQNVFGDKTDNTKPIEHHDETPDESQHKKRPSWAEIFAALDAAGVPDSFLSPEERNQEFFQEREGLFDD